MRLTIRSHDPAWDAEYEAYTKDGEKFRVKTSSEGNCRHIRVFDAEGVRIGHVHQTEHGITGLCRDRELVRVSCQAGLFCSMIPVIQSGCFYGCRMQGGDIRRREYVLYANRTPIYVYPRAYGIAVEYTDPLAQPIEVLVLVLAIEAAAHYT